VAYNSAERAHLGHGEGVTENWKPQEGKIVAGKFRLIQQLGASDHSVVFLTERTEEPRKAVIKLLPAVDAENQILHWKLDTKLPHPNLLRILESGKYELNGHELVYVVMEYAEEDLSQVLPQRPLTPEEARTMLLPTLDALSYLHGKGFVHGSLKPSNILAVTDQVKLASDSITAISEGIAVNGSKATTAYDPPEAKLGKISPASDVWSLGMTLTEVLTLQKPVWDAAKKQEPTLPKELDESFRILIRNCLRPEAANRWSIAEIKSLLQPEKPPAAPVPRSRQTSVWYYIIPIIVIIPIIILLGGGSLLSRMGTLKSRPSGNTEVQVSAKPQPAAPSEQKPANPSVSKPTATAGSPASGTKPKSRVAGQTTASVVQQVLPDVPRSASQTITGTIRIRVRVSVDEDGNVREARLVSPSKSNYFNRLSQQSAEKWKFTPAAGEWFIHFVFTSRGSDASAEPAK